jgi:hypothetical protein
MEILAQSKERSNEEEQAKLLNKERNQGLNLQTTKTNKDTIWPGMERRSPVGAAKGFADGSAEND